MSAAPRPEVSGAPRPKSGLYRLSAAQFMQAAEAGPFGEDRVELLGGVPFAKMTKNPPHNFVASQLLEVIQRATPAGWFVEKETPVRIGPRWQPEPDIMVVRGERRAYRDRWIEADAIALLIEVSDASSLTRDRGRKLRGYARAGIVQYWVVDLVARQFEVRIEPAGPTHRPAYRQTTIHRPGDTLMLALDGREIAPLVVADLLP